MQAPCLGGVDDPGTWHGVRLGEDSFQTSSALFEGRDSSAHRSGRSTPAHHGSNIAVSPLYVDCASTTFTRKAMDDLEQAKALFERALTAFKSGKYPETECLLEQALKLAPGRDSILTNLAAVQLKLDCPEKALAYARRAMELKPDNAEAWLNAGSALVGLNRHDQALAHFEKVLEINPWHAEAWSSRGNTLNTLRNHADALASCSRALELNPELAEAWSAKGKALSALQRHEEALTCHDRAVALRPRIAAAWTSRGNVLTALGRHEEALASHDRAVSLQPAFATAWSNRGHALNELRRHLEALVSCDHALELDPALAEAWTNRGNALTDLARHEEAMASHDRALALKPDFAEAWSNRGITLLYQRKHTDALASFERAKTIAPDYALAHFNEGITRLSLGDFGRGWEEYEWRWNTGMGAASPRIDAPVWHGQALSGTLLAWSEQGLGDQILHMSMLDDAKDLAQRIIVATEHRLVSLAQRSFPDMRVVSWEDRFLAEPIAAWIPMGSLGKHLRTSWNDFPAKRTPYLLADRDRVAALRKRLTGAHGTVCGISWSSKNARLGTHKSIRLRDMLEILRIPGIEFVDLQYGDTQAERDELCSRHGVSLTHLGEIDNTRDIEGLAALISACDMVVTISNTTAHLAGALGLGPYVMLPHGQGRHWYWHEDREDSPWYPGATLIRQPQPNDWQSVLDRVAYEIRERRKSIA